MQRLSTVWGTRGEGNSLSNGEVVGKAQGTSRNLQAVHLASPNEGKGSRKHGGLGPGKLISLIAKLRSFNLCVCNREPLSVL